MHAAWSASLRSSCMSRQVGAAISDSKGEILATGTNDPPAPGGGLYSEEEAEAEGLPDRRCFKWAGTHERPYCRNDHKKKEIYEDIFTKLEDSRALREGVTSQMIRAALERTRVRDLIEFSRAIHAEMDALLALARAGTPVPPEGTLYCTTYPCHSCARHIVASGLTEVIYIEPYAKSLALELHDDAIREQTVSGQKGVESGERRVVFRLFSGVAPRRFSALFEKRRSLKDGDGWLMEREGPAHSDRVLMRSFLQLEEELAKKVDSTLQAGAGDDGARGPTEPSSD
ncbi:deoxycytidylate deaminase-related protein [Plesiocystis pacifica SIR-1]|uniref:Deoxycytidylate deaminase-related protein n=2 Tax=Plesiocystis pacifica TaxID=191768 RepID=A6G477_9BACT|nr:deoxycytidylate deaminase-related protein [Plesiocystis pacifica SIR-1]